MEDEKFWIIVSHVEGIHTDWPYLGTLRRNRQDAIRAFLDEERRDYGDHELTWKNRKKKSYPGIIRNARAIKVILKEGE